MRHIEVDDALASRGDAFSFPLNTFGLRVRTQQLVVPSRPQSRQICA